MDWKNLKGDRCPFDLSKPLPLKGRPCHLTVASEYFFNNNLEYLKILDPEKKYTTSITKIKDVKYELVGIEYMIPNLWSVTKVGYDKDATFGIKHWEEIVVRRADRQLYKFKEGDFVNLHLNDIEEMLILVVQHKLFHLDSEVIVDLAVALHMLRRKWSATDKKRVGIMVDLIDKLMLERQIIRNLERLVGKRELEMDYRLMQRTLLSLMCKTLSNIDAHMQGEQFWKRKHQAKQRDLPRDIPLDRIEVLSCETLSRRFFEILPDHRYSRWWQLLVNDESDS
ncbi:hypothetical protein Tco_0900577 [Tanacetum coccineum]